MENKEAAMIFLQYISDHYDELSDRFKAFCADKSYIYDEDVYGDTILKCHDTILKHGLKDLTGDGIENYFFRSFTQNTKREKQYSRNAKRDNNITDISMEYENYFNNSNITAFEKLSKDLYKDFATLYLLKKIEENFDADVVYVFKLKTFLNLTYKQLAGKTKIKAARQKYITAKQWLKENVTKTEINKAFFERYGNLIN